MASSVATVEELRPTGCTVIVRGNRKKTYEGGGLPGRWTLPGTRRALRESRDPGREVKSEHRSNLARGVQILFSVHKASL